MNIQLPKKFQLYDDNRNLIANIKNGVLYIQRNTSFRHVMIAVTYELKGRDKCYYCGKEFEQNKMVTIDHMIPQEFGGPTIPDNLVACCNNCNIKKRNMNCEQYYKYLEELKKDRGKQFLKELELIREKYLNSPNYQIPEDWIVIDDVKDVVVNIDLSVKYQGAKYNKIKNFYSKYNKLKNPIIVDKREFLLDGFLSLMFCKNYEIKYVPKIILENVQVVI